jgi:hypothetical protein
MVELLKKVDKYYEEQKNKIDKVYKERTITNIEFNEIQGEEKHLVNLSNNDTAIASAEYSYMGIYDKTLGMWKWAWGFLYIDPKLRIDADKVRDYQNEIKKMYTNEDAVIYEQLYYMTKNGYFFIKKGEMLKLIKLMLYITKGLWFVPIESKENNHEILTFIMLKKIVRE